MVLSWKSRFTIIVAERLRSIACLDGGVIFRRWQDHSRLFNKWGIIRCTETLLKHPAIAVFRSAYGNFATATVLPGSVGPSPRPLPEGEGE
jgi:hypothetical protein